MEVLDVAKDECLDNLGITALFTEDIPRIEVCYQFTGQALVANTAMSLD
jgi:hypothetical protein